MNPTTHEKTQVALQKQKEVDCVVAADSLSPSIFGRRTSSAMSQRYQKSTATNLPKIEPRDYLYQMAQGVDIAPSGGGGGGDAQDRLLFFSLNVERYC
eukprot:scaffold3843_cov73-Cylindrotheca_fusiformis.AAC.1